MSPDEQTRHQVQNLLAEAIGPDAASYVITHLSPDEWPHLATKSDLEALRAATKSDIQELRAATGSDIQELGAATQSDIQDLRTATKSEKRHGSRVQPCEDPERGF
jgi:regulator of RNase E activity RraB